MVKRSVWFGAQVQVDHKADLEPQNPDGFVYCRLVKEHHQHPVGHIIYIPKKWLSLKKPMLPVEAHEAGLKAGPPQ